MASGTCIRLNSGYDIPVIGLGTWKSGEVGNAVRAAIDAGYRHFDCAYIYVNEREVGQALQDKVKEGKVSRQDLFIVSKLWNTRHRACDVKPSLQESLDNLGVEYLDLYLMHWPISFQPGDDLYPADENGQRIFVDIPIMETWRALEECVDEGLVRSIGVSNFNSQQIDLLIDKGRIPPAINQVEMHPFFSNDRLTQHCRKRGVVMTAYSPLASPARPWWARTSALDKRSADNPSSLLTHPDLMEIAQKHKKSVAQVVPANNEENTKLPNYRPVMREAFLYHDEMKVVLRWFVQRGVCVIPKSVTPSRIAENIEIFDFELSDADMQTINGLDQNIRIMVCYTEENGQFVFTDRHAPNFPYNIDY